MRKPYLHKKPPYALTSVDNALRLLQILRDTGGLRLTDAAAELDVAPSTAHRLFAMLIYRGFVIQDDDRTYIPGPAMGEGPTNLDSTKKLRSLAYPYLDLLSADLKETSNLMIRTGTNVRFLLTIEGSNLLKVGDRRGTVLPAHTTSGGKALLAALDPILLERLYRGHRGDRFDDQKFARLSTELELVRKRGFARNDQETEEGVIAVGMTVRDGSGKATAAISVAVPSARRAKLADPSLYAEMADTIAALESELLAHGVGV